MPRWWSTLRRRLARARRPRLSHWQTYGLALILAVLIWRAGVSHAACHLPIAVKATNFDDRTWCFEFWINRYQTLIASLVAVAAAIAAWQATRSQTNIARYQRVHETLGNLQRMALISPGAYLGLSLASNIENLSLHALAGNMTKETRLAFLDRRDQELVRVREAWEKFVEITMRTPMSEDLYSSLTEFRGAGFNLRSWAKTNIVLARSVFIAHDDDDC